ncbi:hypothetical protein BGX27_008410 [Mortierella sp. AM989]|nr:hypothetical protein BGX27_008410 [Mortierella sp. AM989]
MSRYNWLDPHRSHRKAINSWKQMLLDHDERSAASALKRGDLLDDKTKSAADTFGSSIKGQVVCPALEAIRLLKLKKRKINRNNTDSFIIPQEQSYKGQHNKDITNCDDSDTALRHRKDQDLELAQATETFESKNTTNGDLQQITELKLAIASLRSKLEMLQPEGARPSDIAAALTESLSKQKSDGGALIEDVASTSGGTENEVLLSQDVASQRSILLWDEIRALVEALNSSRKDTRIMAESAMYELGIENLEDGVLHRLCTNEIFTRDQDDDIELRLEGSTETDQSKIQRLSYQVSQTLCRILFCQKVI